MRPMPPNSPAMKMPGDVGFKRGRNMGNINAARFSAKNQINALRRAGRGARAMADA